jgi:hypothetical protein
VGSGLVLALRIEIASPVFQLGRNDLSPICYAGICHYEAVRPWQSPECKSGISPPIVGIIIRQVKTTICVDKRCVGVRSVIPFVRDRVVWESQIGYSAHVSIPPIPLGSKRITRLVCFLKPLRVVPGTIITRRIITNESRVVIAGNRKRINAQEQNRC